jgi:hypothetical protein
MVWAVVLINGNKIREKKMKTLFNTGRDYGAPQVLEIECEPVIDDFELVNATFIDAARGISGQVQIFGIDVNAQKIGRAVLAEYDEGRYQIIQFKG